MNAGIHTGHSSIPSNPGLFWSRHQRLFAEGPGKAPPAFNTSAGTGKGAALSLAVVGRMNHWQRRKEHFASCNKGLLGARGVSAQGSHSQRNPVVPHRLLCCGTVYLMSLGSDICLQSQHGGVSLHRTPKIEPVWQMGGMDWCQSAFS